MTSQITVFNMEGVAVASASVIVTASWSRPAQIAWCSEPLAGVCSLCGSFRLVDRIRRTSLELIIGSLKLTFALFSSIDRTMKSRCTPNSPSMEQEH